MMKQYRGDYLQKIVFPLSGIGTGGVSLSGTGRLVDWELDGRANKETGNEYTHFAIKAEQNGKVIDARVLAGDCLEDLCGSSLACYHHSWGYGHGINRTTLAGIPHCSDVTFEGRFPFANIDYREPKMPAEVHLSAMNPFIPKDEENSSIPAAFFSFDVVNTTTEQTDYTIALSCGNPFKISNGGYSSCRKDEKSTSLTFKSRHLEKEQTAYGELTVATDADHCSYQEYWFRSGWFDDLTTFWREFTEPGDLKNRHYDDDDRRGQFDVGDMGTLAARVSLKPGERKTVRFLLTWYYPWYEKYWDEKKPRWKHEYVRRFSSSLDVADYCFAQWDTLEEKSRAFSDALDAMTLPDVVKESAADNLCVLKSPTCLRLENGEFWGFEGTNGHGGSCEGTCDHVWLYQYALPLLFPHFARQILEIVYTYNMRESGEMPFRTMLPLGSERWNFRACADGQMGCVIRAYREWKLSGDTAWLKKWWPLVKKSLEYAWSPENKDRWDPDKSGVLTGRQHHTLDVELFGPNAWLTGYYLTALKAAAEMADALGEPESAAEYREIFSRGQQYLERELFNGRHYQQKVDVKDRSLLTPYEKDDPLAANYWNDETGELKYQIADGSEIDQVVAQWHATLCGLGDIYDPTHRKTAIETIYRLNFRSMRDVVNHCRVYAVNDERGAVMCAWADGANKPKIPIPYAEECMTGFEYALSGLLIQEGFLQKGLDVAKAVRERYDGKKRNPFSEIECGAAYARSMATFAYLPIFSGMKFDMTRGYLGFSPIEHTDCFFCPWFVGDAYGTVEITKEKVSLSLLGGNLTLNAFSLPLREVTSVLADGKEVSFTRENGEIKFSHPVTAGSEFTFLA